jgi:hypothetical protein
MPRRPRDTRYPIGKYGAGTLWFERNGWEHFILFDAVRIAKLGHPGTPREGTWVSLEPGWKVTAPFGVAEIRVQHNDNEGVVLAIGGGMK